LKHVGLALATAISAWLNVSLLMAALFRRGYWQLDARLKSRLIKGIACSAAMGAALWAGAGFLESAFDGDRAERVGALVAIVIGGVVVYGVLIHVSGALRLSEAKGLLRRSGGQEDKG